MNHFAGAGRGQGRHQGIEAADAQRVDAPYPSAGCELQKAQFGKESALAQKFRVDADPPCGFLRLRGRVRKRLRERFQLVLSVDPNRVGHTFDPRVQFGIDYD